LERRELLAGKLARAVLRGRGGGNVTLLPGEARAGDGSRPPNSYTRSYGCTTTIAAPYAQAITRTRAALTEQGFGVLTEIDVKKTLKEKLDVEFRPYVILGACNPALARRALEADLGVGLLLPCNVVVYDNGDGTSTVAAIDPLAALGIVGDNPALATVAHEAQGRLYAAVERLMGA